MWCEEDRLNLRQQHWLDRGLLRTAVSPDPTWVLLCYRCFGRNRFLFQVAESIVKWSMTILAVYVAQRDVMVFEGKFSSQLRNDQWDAIIQPTGPHRCYQTDKDVRSEFHSYQETTWSGKMRVNKICMLDTCSSCLKRNCRTKNCLWEQNLCTEGSAV